MIVELVRNAVGFLASLPVRLVPRRFRFRVTMAAGWLLAPVLGPILLARYGNTTGGAADETLRVLFRAMVRMRLRHDPRLEADVDPELLPALQAGGVLLVSGHFPINAFFIRWLHDQGYPITAVRETPGPGFAWGTTSELDLLPPSQNVMLQLRSKLAEGRPVVVIVDNARPTARPMPVETRFGANAIATPIFTLAEKLGVPMFFYGVRAAKRGNPLLTVRRIPPDPKIFAEHFRRHTELMLP
jgi:hypothetical protein